MLDFILDNVASQILNFSPTFIRIDGRYAVPYILVDENDKVILLS